MAEFSFTKFEDKWCIRVWDGAPDLTGGQVKIKTRSGDERDVVLGELLDGAGKKQIYAIASQQTLPKVEADVPLPGKDIVPAGRYAYPIEVDGQEQWQFVKIWRRLDRVAAYAVKGREQGAPVNKRHALEAIVAYGVGLAAQQYGWRTGHCGRCGDELKVNLSRKLGMGPVCMKAVYADGPRLTLMRTARKELRDAGLEPDGKFDSLEAVS
jgi:hypothetical protein